MNISDWFGLLSVAMFLGCVCGSLFYGLSRTWRLITAGIVTLLSFIPLPFDTGACIAMYIYAITGLLCIPLLTAIVCHAIGIYQPNRRKRAAITFVVAGLILYLGEIGILPFDLFQFGYNPVYALIIAIIGMVLTDAIGAVVLLASYFLFIIGIYDNFFTAIVDPILWGIAIVFLVRETTVKILKMGN